MRSARAETVIGVFLTGSVLGLVAGSLPGPFLAFVAATAVEHGSRAGQRVALAPLAVELPVMLVTVLLLAAIPSSALRWIGVAGGAILAGLGAQVILGGGSAESRYGRGPDPSGEAGTRNLVKLAGAGLLSPSPWAFWILVGAPLVLAAWRRDPALAALLVGSFLAAFVGTQMAVATLAARGASLLDREWRRRIRRVVGVVMLAGGLVLVWQAWEGNYQELVQVQQRAAEVVR